jgi:hypothetical protein
MNTTVSGAGADVANAIESAAEAPTERFLTADGDVLTADMAGMDSALFDTFFINGVQIKCAAGEWCTAHPGASLDDSFHRCMSCGLKIHSALLCGRLFGEWLEDNQDGSFNPTMLPCHGHRKYDAFVQGSSSMLDMCHRGRKNIERKMSSGISNVKTEEGVDSARESSPIDFYILTLKITLTMGVRE